MSNGDIVDVLELTAKLLELHGADPFKIKSYSIAGFYIDKYKDAELKDLSIEQLVKIQGIGKSMAAKIVEIIRTGTFPDLEELLQKTPSGVLDMFQIKGIGPKKIALIWHELGIENLSDLEQACLNGEISKLKGFGGSIQQKIIDSLAFLKQQSGKLRMNVGGDLANRLVAYLKTQFAGVEVVGQVRQKAEIVEQITILVATNQPGAVQHFVSTIPELSYLPMKSSPFVWRGKEKETGVEVEIISTHPDRFINEYFIESSSPAHLGRTNSSGETLWKVAISGSFTDEKEIYTQSGLPYIVPEMREGLNEFEWAEKHTSDDLVTWDSLKGILHNHSTYSDGRHTLEQMAVHCKSLGFEYLGIADHSQTATYAQGLKVEDVLRQHAEIALLNERFASENADRPFKIIKGIESDILGDGSLDYPSEILATFDYIVASVHSNLSMTKEKATSRLIRAIENPFTTILGHPTGRLLLSREGYPIDHKAVIDACAAHQVVMEINASPWRLDMDWRWIDYCLERGVLLSINPDAHAMEGYLDMHYGVGVARKGGLTKEMTFNALSLAQIESYLKSRHA
jgi:DNA polymerase (family 10)